MTSAERIAFQNGFAVGFVKGGDTYISKIIQGGDKFLFDVVESNMFNNMETISISLFDVIENENYFNE